MAEQQADAAFAAQSPYTQETYAEESYRKFFGIDGFNVFKLNLLQETAIEHPCKKQLGNMAFMALHAPLEHRKQWLAALIQTTERLKAQK